MDGRLASERLAQVTKSHDDQIGIARRWLAHYKPLPMEFTLIDEAIALALCDCRPVSPNTKLADALRYLQARRLNPSA